MEADKHSNNPDVAWLQSLKPYEQYLLEIEASKLDTRFNRSKRIGPDEYMPNYVRITSSMQEVYEYNPLKMTPYGAFCAVRELHEEGMAFLILRGALLTSRAHQEEDDDRLDYVQFLAESVYEECDVQKGQYRSEPMIAAFSQFVEGAHAVYYRACSKEHLEIYKDNGMFSEQDMYVLNIEANDDIHTFYVDRTPVISIDTMKNISVLDAQRKIIR